MKIGHSPLLVVASLLIAAPAFLQTAQAQTPASQTQTPQVKKQATQDGNSPTTVGPASKAYKQKTQSMAHSDPSAYKQKTQGDLPEVGPASGAYNGNVPRSKY